MSAATVTMRIRNLTADTWDELVERISTATGWKPDDLVYAYAEALGSCSLLRRPLAAAEPAEDAWEGRLFAADAEVRWLREEARDPYSAWVTDEASGDDARTCETFDRRYYLIGMFSRRAGAFVESRYPGAGWDSDPCWGDLRRDARENDRAYILVREYSAARPERWPESAAEAGALLDDSGLVGHRFVQVGVGSDDR